MKLIDRDHSIRLSGLLTLLFPLPVDVKTALSSADFFSSHEK